MERVIAYIDGFNLYYGLKAKEWKWAYWLNIHLMTKNLLPSHYELALTKYFTTRINEPQDKKLRQQKFLEALKTIPDIKFYYGKYVPDDVKCRNCGHTYTTYHEKRTDVNIAVEMMADAANDRFDVAVLVSGDGDLLNLVYTVKNLFGKKLFLVFPPERVQRNLKRAANIVRHIDSKLLSRSLLPDEVVKPNGYILKKPEQWR